MLISIVIPCYNSEKSIRNVVEMTYQVVSKRLPEYDCEFVLVDDCSRDDTYTQIQRLAEDYPFVHGATLMRNFGQHNAIMCGLNIAKGDLIMGMDDDMQTHPSQIPLIIDKMMEGYDVVYGVYPQSTNGVLKNITSWLNCYSAQKMLGRSKDIKTSNFWMIRKCIRDEVIKYKNYNPYVDALYSRMTNRIGNVEVEHHERMHGSSNYTLTKLFKLWLSYFNYTTLPLRFVSSIGFVMSAVGLAATIFTVLYKLIVPDVLVGWSSLICVMLFFFGLILLVLGIIGEYLGDLVLSANGTPQFVVRDLTDLGKLPSSQAFERE
ncbi:glycosyltransferase family 2 protein [Adlercreutzia sp. ZJ141]|uniref:glycosyltransferase family 2 protein n=1 Tax=Adlercreutzia sp. ZJ141 TaxID=2709406 RepID=UPI0013EAA3AD|nr:glycosyltransferase family 2 protein [Adlercreutzia sp. ZJ141]